MGGYLRLMTIQADQMGLLKLHLEQKYVAHLPELLKKKSPDEDLRKNIDRAFAAFSLADLCELTPEVAAKAVVDDFDDFGIDAIYYDASSETLYLVQAKLKSAGAFKQEEANAFCQGIRKIIKQDYTGFNQNVLDRQTAIDGALEQCSKIEVVIAHTGDGITAHAKQAVDELLADEGGCEERLKGPIISFDSNRVVAALQGAHAMERVDCRIRLQNYGAATDPRIAYYGSVTLSQLVALHKKHDKALYEKNIRTFLGQTTEVNRAIRDTLENCPENFQYLNNGVTALCERIEPKNGTAKEKSFSLGGVSIINGAQTVASTARFAEDFPDKDISSAKVMLTLIKANSDGSFGKAVTRARNHQNPVLLANFAALDDEQERLRRDLAHLGITYVYKAEGWSGSPDPKRILIAEAVQALAVLEPDPRYAVLLKKEPAQFLDTEGEAYKAVFSASLSGYRLANAVAVYRYVRERVQVEVAASGGQERLTYKHGEYALACLFGKRVRDVINGTALIDPGKLRQNAGAQFDAARQALWDAMRPRLFYRGPLATFRNLTEGVPLIRDSMIAHYGLRADPAISQLRAKFVAGQSYQVDLYKYLSANAPQIGNLT